MESILPVYLMVFGIILVVIPLLLARHDETTSRNLAKIRVPVDDRRRSRQLPEPADDDFENFPVLELTIAGTIMLLLVVVLSGL